MIAALVLVRWVPVTALATSVVAGAGGMITPRFKADFLLLLLTMVSLLC